MDPMSPDSGFVHLSNDATGGKGYVDNVVVN